MSNLFPIFLWLRLFSLSFLHLLTCVCFGHPPPGTIPHFWAGLFCPFLL
jgi:hypothetical protein